MLRSGASAGQVCFHSSADPLLRQQLTGLVRSAARPPVEESIASGSEKEQNEKGLDGAEFRENSRGGFFWESQLDGRPVVLQLRIR